MPQFVSEIAKSDIQKNNSGQGVAGAVSRHFRVVLLTKDEDPSYESVCGVTIGSAHPLNANLLCTSFNATSSSESGLTTEVTFNYEYVADAENKNQPPDVRPANWGISVSIEQAPVRSWRKRTGGNDNPSWGARIKAQNSAGDIYDGVSAPFPVVRITIEQFETTDPTRHVLYAGAVNSEVITLGSLTIQPHQLMFMGVGQSPATESWGDLLFKGWKANYEFLFKKNKQKINDNLGATVDADIGWDIAVPQTGFNCIAFDPTAPGADDDPYGQPLNHGDEDSDHFGRIDETNLLLPEGVAAGDRVRAMVKVFSYRGGGTSQAPSASPIALNDNGRPRLWDSEPIVYAYQPGESINFTQTLGLRLF